MTASGSLSRFTRKPSALSDNRGCPAGWQGFDSRCPGVLTVPGLPFAAARMIKSGMDIKIAGKIRHNFVAI